jgi:hypothetical protein
MGWRPPQGAEARPASPTRCLFCCFCCTAPALVTILTIRTLFGFFEAARLALDRDDFGAMDESIDKRYDASSAWKDLLPLGKPLVGGNYAQYVIMCSSSRGRPISVADLGERDVGLVFEVRIILISFGLVNPDRRSTCPKRSSSNRSLAHGRNILKPISQ